MPGFSPASKSGRIDSDPNRNTVRRNLDFDGTYCLLKLNLSNIKRKQCIHQSSWCMQQSIWPVVPPGLHPRQWKGLLSFSIIAIISAYKGTPHASSAVILFLADDEYTCLSILLFSFNYLTLLNSFEFLFKSRPRKWPEGYWGKYNFNFPKTDLLHLLQTKPIFMLYLLNQMILPFHFSSTMLVQNSFEFSITATTLKPLPNEYNISWNIIQHLLHIVACCLIVFNRGWPNECNISYNIIQHFFKNICRREYNRVQ